MKLFPDWWLFRPGSLSLRSSVLNKSSWVLVQARSRNTLLTFHLAGVSSLAVSVSPEGWDME